MFDFRYHAVSLVAVLVALVVGLLLGVAIGDAGLVSSAERSLRSDLREDVAAARTDAREAREARDAADRFADESYPLLVAGRLDGERVGLLILGTPSDRLARDVRRALEPSGATLEGTMALREPPDLAALADAAGDTRYATLEDDPSLLGPFGQRIGIQLVQGGSLLEDEAEALFAARAGTLGPFDAVVVSRNQPDGLEGEAREQTNDLEDGLMEGITDNPVAAVGVETTGTDPSQVEWYRDHGLSSVDNIDTVAGRAALVFALGGVTGSFGTGSGADALLPGPESVSG